MIKLMFNVRVVSLTLTLHMLLASAGAATSLAAAVSGNMSKEDNKKDFHQRLNSNASYLSGFHSTINPECNSNYYV